MSDEPDDIRAQLAALADDTLAAPARERILARVRDSPELARELEIQRRAVAIVRSLEELPAPASLRRSIQAPAAVRPPRRRATPRLRLAGALALAAVTVAALVAALGGSSPGAPTVPQAAALALLPATRPSPAESPRDRGLLVGSVEGIPYPYWGAGPGWRTAGARTDRLGGRTITTVFYADGASRRIGYAIVAGHALAPPHGTGASHEGVRFQVLSSAGATVVTWRRAGHTCILAARGVSARTLIDLATWQ